MRTKSAILVVGINDTMMSYDLHIIDVMNNLRNRMNELTWMKLMNELMSVYNAPGALPFHKLVFTNDKLQIVKLGLSDASINEYNYWDVIYSKKDIFMSLPIYEKLCEYGYSKVIENTPVRFKNINTLNFLSTFNNFVVLETKYKWNELPLLGHITSGDNMKQIILWNDLGKWLNNQTELQQDNDLAILLTLISPNEDVDKEVAYLCLRDVPDDKHRLIACESRVITYNPRIDVDKLRKLSDSGEYRRSNLAGVKLFNPNMTSKL